MFEMGGDGQSDNVTQTKLSNLVAQARQVGHSVMSIEIGRSVIEQMIQEKNIFTRYRKRQIYIDYIPFSRLPQEGGPTHIHMLLNTCTFVLAVMLCVTVVSLQSPFTQNHAQTETRVR